MRDYIIGMVVGIIIGWVTKVPFLLKWYREIKETKDYRDMKRKEYLDKFEESKTVQDNKPKT